MKHCIKELKRAIESSQRGMQTGKMYVHRQYVVEALHLLEAVSAENERLRSLVERQRDLEAQLQGEINDLEAQIIDSGKEALVLAAKRIPAWDCSCDTWLRNHAAGLITRSTRTSPTEHDADVARRAIIETLTDLPAADFSWHPDDIEAVAEAYAERVKRGDV